jgi:undecaprenyl-diphosphatase
VNRHIHLFLIMGLMLSAGSLWLLATLTKNTIASPSLTRFDTNLIDGLYLQSNPTARAVLQAIAFAGNEGVIALGALVALLFVRRRQWYYLAVWAIALLGGHLLNDLLKEIVARPRPVFENMLVTEDTYSFPSGHAMTSIIVSGMLAYFLVIGQHSRRYRALVLLIAVLVVLIIGSSRLFLGLHYFSDVLAGFVAGGIWLATCITALEVIRWQSKTRL